MSHGKTKMTTNAPIRPIIRDIRNTLVYLKQSGCTGFDCNAASLKILNQLGPARQAAAVDRETLADIRTDLGECTRCGLCEARTHIVFGEGSPNAQVVFVGEGPGFDEDRCGRPFVGAAGQLLTKIIAAMRLTRETVYIAILSNAGPRTTGTRRLKKYANACRFSSGSWPPSIRASSVPWEVWPPGPCWTPRRPSLASGGGSMRVMGTQLMPTYHPAYLLRNPARKRDVWEDVQQIMNRLE
jgi:uracil-DNA glycosylase